MDVRDKLYIGGAWVSSRGTDVIEVVNSATEEVIGTIPAGTPEDVDRAARCAADAFGEWSATSREERSKTLERVQGLSEKSVVSRQTLDEAVNTDREAAAALLAAKAKVAEAELNLSYTTIRAPITGLSSFATKHDGSYIGEGENSMLTYVAAIDPIWVKFSASENYWLRLQEEVKAGRLVVPPDDAFDVEVVLADGRIHPQKGRLTFTDLAFSRDTGTYLVRAEVSNPEEDLSPGQFVRARLLGAVRPKAILLPKRAVLQGAKGSFVWVVGPQSKAELRPIELGDWYGDEWFVNEGLHSGDTVVVDGGIKVQPGATLKVVEPAVQLETK